MSPRKLISVKVSLKLLSISIMVFVYGCQLEPELATTDIKADRNKVLRHNNIDTPQCLATTNKDRTVVSFPIGTEFSLTDKPDLSAIKIASFCTFKSKSEKKELMAMLPELSRLDGVDKEVRCVWYAWPEKIITAKAQMGNNHFVYLEKDMKTEKWRIVCVTPMCGD